MLINFCYSGLTENVFSSVVSSEGYEARNLISCNLNLRKKGFLAESFVKPPVVLQFDFVCEVNINHIVILTSVGSQKSIGVELFSRNSESLNFRSLSSGLIKQSENGFVFHKHGDHIKHILPEHYRALSFHTFNSFQFLKTNVIQVKIFRTKNSTIPTLGKIEIWGHPSRNCSKNIVDSIYKTWEKIQHEQNYTSKSFFQNPYMESDLSTSRSESIMCKSVEPGINISGINENSVNSLPHLSNVVDLVPEEFIDPITCEIMILPVILPSGKVIDSRTLEKHTEAESKWGRAASDPFTGKLLTENHKTIFASDLKLRIDKFLCDNSHEDAFKYLPRTVGRKFKYNMTINANICKKSNLNFQKQIMPSEATFIPETKLNFKNIESNVCHKKDITLQAKQNLTQNYQQWNKSCTKDPGHTIVNNDQCEPISNSGVSLNASGNQVTEKECIKGERKPHLKNLSYEEESEFALENALRLTLSSLPTYSSVNTVLMNNTECNKCCSKDNLFQLPCDHFLCRTCLLSVIKSKLLKCDFCQTKFKSSDPQRFYQ